MAENHVFPRASSPILRIGPRPRSWVRSRAPRAKIGWPSPWAGWPPPLSRGAGQYSVLNRPCGGLCARPQAQPVQDVLDMLFGGAFAYEKAFSNLSVGVCQCNKTRHLQLATTQ